MKFKLKKRVSEFSIVFFCILVILTSIDMHYVQGADASDNPEMTFSSIFTENFENDWNKWFSDHGVWEIGVPLSGPEKAYSGLNCAATILDGNYPQGPDSRLISPKIRLNAINAGQEIILRFRQFFNYAINDRASIQIKLYENKAWSEWINLKTFSSYSVLWHHERIDLTPYADKIVRIGFFHEDKIESDIFMDNPIQRSGWYIDDIEITMQQIPVFTGFYDFESGWNNWHSDNGIWEIGEPLSWPEKAYSGLNCAATILDGNYPQGPDSRFISPVIELEQAEYREEIFLQFHHIFLYSALDRGVIQIKIFENEQWTDWETLVAFKLSTPLWRQDRVNLTPFAGKKIMIAFYHKDTIPDSIFEPQRKPVKEGWYIDDVKIIKQKIPVFTGFDNFESGSTNWHADNYIWQIGEPSRGPDSAYEGVNCAATILDDKYPFGRNARLTSSMIELPLLEDGQEIALRFKQFFSYSSLDKGHVQISTYNKSWSGWTTLKTISSFTPVWHHAHINLTAYEGENIRISFYHEDLTETTLIFDTPKQDFGWYIDDIAIEIE